MGGDNPPASTLRVTLIQPSVPQTLIWDESENTNRFRQLLQLSQTALTNQSDLLIWPESAVPEFDDANYIAITNLIRAHHVWLIFNADDAVPHPNATNEFDNDVFNAAFLFNSEGSWAATYHKQKLVIFGEYIPLVRWLPFVKWFTPITGGFAAGNKPVQFQINRASWNSAEPIIGLNNGSSGASPHQTVNASPLICYEDMFPQVARGAVHDDTDFLVNLTNDGWFGQSAEQWQHMAGAVFRAVENGVPLVRCCNNGVTCWIDAHGRVREIFRDNHGSVYGMGTLTIDLPLQNHTPTFYNRHGDWFGLGCVAVGVVLPVTSILQRRKRNA
jgi:apolipoprotein N-acyltransferase